MAHYSDALPQSHPYEKRKPSAAARNTALAASDAAATPQSTTPTAASNCETARRNLETFERFDNMQMDRDGDGAPETLGQ